MSFESQLYNLKLETTAEVLMIAQTEHCDARHSMTDRLVPPTHSPCHGAFVVSKLHGLIPIRLQASQPVPPTASAELLRPAYSKLNEFLDIGMDSPKLTSHAGKVEVVIRVMKCGHLFIDSLNAE